MPNGRLSFCFSLFQSQEFVHIKTNDIRMALLFFSLRIRGVKNIWSYEVNRLFFLNYTMPSQRPADLHHRHTKKKYVDVVMCFTIFIFVFFAFLLSLSIYLESCFFSFRSATRAQSPLRMRNAAMTAGPSAPRLTSAATILVSTPLLYINVLSVNYPWENTSRSCSR